MMERYVLTKDVLQLKPVYDALLLSYLDDVEKYAASSGQIQVMRHCIRSCFAEAGERIKFVGFGHSSYSSKDVGEALRTLSKNAEVDFLLSTSYGIIPIEVKSGATGHLKSLLLYVEESKSPLAIRLYAGEYRREELETPNGHKFTLLNLPYCFAGKLQEYVKALITYRDMS